MRLRRACVLLEVIDDDTGQLTAIGYELEATSVAEIEYEYGMSIPYGRDGSLFCDRATMKPSKYRIKLDGAGREFHMNLGTWFDTPPPQELNPATPEIEA